MKNNLLQHQKNAGFTIIELMIVIAILGIFLTVGFEVFKSQQRSYLAQDQVVEMQENIRAGVELMTQELRMAGYDPYSTGNFGIQTATTSSITFTWGSSDESGAKTTITFDLEDADGDGDKDICRQEGTSAKSAIAENFEDLEFYYLAADGDSPTDIAEITSIQISVLARVQRPDTVGFINNDTYTTASGTTWGPYNDSYRRRFQTITVYLRNV